MKIFASAASLGLLTAIALSGAAVAQTAAPAAAPAQPNPGPVIPGVCTYSQERAVATSAVGQSVATRMKQLMGAADAELTADRNSLQAEQARLQSIQATTPKDQFDQQALAFNQRVQAFEVKTQTRSQELQYTEGKQVERIQQAIDPILKQVYQERGCGLMLDRGSLYGANPAMDVTQVVIGKLNATLTTLTFDRMALPQQGPGGQAAAPARPAAAAPTVSAPAAPAKKKK